MKLTRPQLALFWRAFASACAGLGLVTKEDKDAYRKQVMQEETGKSSVKELNRTADFDAVVQRFLVDGQSYNQALHFNGAALSRLHYLIGEAAAKIVAASKFRGSGWAYVVGVMIQARIIDGTPAQWADRLASSSVWMDFAEKDVRRVLCMLTTHVRRLAS
jgi:hypothetical protein